MWYLQDFFLEVNHVTLINKFCYRAGEHRAQSDLTELKSKHEMLQLEHRALHLRRQAGQVGACVHGSCVMMSVSFHHESCVLLLITRHNDMTHSHVRHDACFFVTLLIHTPLSLYSPYLNLQIGTHVVSSE